MKKQKTRRASAPRNRYVVRAKLSEHKFLRILHGYAEGTPIQKLEPRTHVSGNTIRATYRMLRGNLPDAATVRPTLFGYAGPILMHENAPMLLHAIRPTRRFRRHRQRHAPRLSCPVEEERFLTEKIVRLLCALDLRALPLQEDEDAVAELIENMVQAFPELHPRKPRQALAELIPGAQPFAHDGMRLYEDYRRCLLRSPLGTLLSSGIHQHPRFSEYPLIT
ncbi:hypothetical protein [Hyphomicrobium nitrativorans]|uniref:hypothetical protein n=1 Tax=Hyphomicrobium nitrativorans TaxID=1427356 RepID=UPI001AEC00AF|nr:hypothetical protein [Hyphomicrobium nitrativorans]